MIRSRCIKWIKICVGGSVLLADSFVPIFKFTLNLLNRTIQGFDNAVGRPDKIGILKV